MRIKKPSPTRGRWHGGAVTDEGAANLIQPLSQPAADSLSLRLGHGAALTCHRHVIHYRAAASLPKRGAKGAVRPVRQS